MFGIICGRLASTNVASALISLPLPNNKQKLGVKIESFMAVADATVYVWLLCQIDVCRSLTFTVASAPAMTGSVCTVC